MKNRFLTLALAGVIAFTPLTAHAQTNHLTKRGGVYNSEWGFHETYYNLDMSGIVKLARRMGYSEEEYPYTETADGIKMLGDYVIVAANLKYYPRGTIVNTSWGEGIVLDTGTALRSNWLDLAVTW